MTRIRSFKEDPAKSKLLAWHASLAQDRGARARLRRAPSPAEVAYEPAFYRLLRDLSPGAEAFDAGEREALAAVAGLAARVEEHAPGPSLAAQMGTPNDKREKAAPVSGLRFRRLLTLDDPAERFAHLSRIIDLLGRRVNLPSLADAAYRWDLRTRQQFAYDYYQASPEK